MKKSILLGIGLAMMTLALSSCGGFGGLRLAEDNDGTELTNAIEKKDLSAMISLNPAFEQAYHLYANGPEKKEKVLAFAVDMLGNMEKREPGSNMQLYVMLTSKNNKQVNLALETAMKKFDSEVFAYAGTLDLEKVFQKIFTDY